MNLTAPQLEAMTKPRQNGSAIAHLLHALNQPITGLQCSLELAVARPRSGEEYVRTLREGLELIARIRTLVEALRTATDALFQKQEDLSIVHLSDLLRVAVGELLPVAESRQVRLLLVTEEPLAVRGCDAIFAKLLFRLLESALSLAKPMSDVKVFGARDSEHARISVSWVQESASACITSSQNPGLLVAQAEWESVGAQWSPSHSRGTRTCSVLLPLFSSAT